MTIFLICLILIFLTTCFGPELFTIGGIKITYKDVITVPHKIETLQKEKEKNDVNSI
jgi:hypothetical protein